MKARFGYGEDIWEMNNFYSLTVLRQSKLKLTSTKQISVTTDILKHMVTTEWPCWRRVVGIWTSYVLVFS